MARFILLDKGQYSNEGIVPIKRGDDVAVSGTIVEKIAEDQTPIDLTGISASAYFAGEAAVIIKPITIVDAANGKFFVEITNSESLLLSTTEPDQGTSFYVVVNKAGKLSTIETNDSPLEVLDRDFKN